MKNILIFLLLLLPPLLFAGCTADRHNPGEDGLSVTLAVDEMRIQTRNPSIPAQEGETTVNDLTLLFFEYEPDGSGRFVKSVTTTNPKMNGRYDIPFDAQITGSGSYTILAMANTKGYFDGNDIDGLFAALTEREAIDMTTAKISGTGTDETDNAKAIKPDNLIMSARVVRSADQNNIEVRLARCVARFDVENGVKGGYDLVSASIWSAVSESPMWHDRVIPGVARTERFYGISRTDDFSDIERGLYAFGNYVAKPEAADNATTCIVLGLKPAGDDMSKTTYYRVNVNIPGSAQNLLRNHVYRIRIDEVTAAGADTEYDAWRRSASGIRVSIDLWNSDDSDFVQTDGENILIIPARRVNLDPAGETREYSIITRGTGTLTISRYALPPGIDVDLTGGRLVITAEEFTGGLERRGTIELSFAGLRNVVTIVQSRPSLQHIKLNRYEIPEFAATGRSYISDNIPFTVSASGTWTARITNFSEDAANPGFSFGSAGEPVTLLRSAENPYADMFQIYTTGTNLDTAQKRQGILVVTLDDDPDNFNCVVVLTQAASAP